ncbi:MAG TPA: NAD(P)/FAD-dependent oxidoreductase [Thermoanaerobaculia bacterium]
MPKSPSSQVLIVGAGPAGLAVGACLTRLGLRVRLLERGDAPGCSWARHYESLRLHTPRSLSSLPGLRFSSTSDYPDRTEVLAYLAEYARRFDLEIDHGREATALVREDGGWRVETSGGAYRARHVVLATGCFMDSREPDWPGRERFQGRWLRPADVRSGDGWRDRHALVVGLGNTAADLVTDIHRGGGRVALSVRGPVYVVPLEILGVNCFRWRQGLPERAPTLRRFLGHGAGDAAEKAGARFWWRLQERRYGDLRDRGLALKSPEEIERDHRSGLPPVIGGPWVDLVRRGEAPVFPGISEITPEGALFTDGRRAAFTDIVVATGYEKKRFPLAGDLESPRDGAVPGQPGLWLCGAAPVLRHIRRAARRVAREIAHDPGLRG